MKSQTSGTDITLQQFHFKESKFIWYYDKTLYESFDNYRFNARNIISNDKESKYLTSWILGFKVNIWNNTEKY
jgi:hypothetical protein